MLNLKNLKIFAKNSTLKLKQKYNKVWTHDYKFQGYDLDPEYGGILGTQLNAYATAFSQSRSPNGSTIDPK